MIYVNRVPCGLVCHRAFFCVGEKIKNGKKFFKNGQKMGDFEKNFLIT